MTDLAERILKLSAAKLKLLEWRLRESSSVGRIVTTNFGATQIDLSQSRSDGIAGTISAQPAAKAASNLLESAWRPPASDEELLAKIGELAEADVDALLGEMLDQAALAPGVPPDRVGREARGRTGRSEEETLTRLNELSDEDVEGLLATYLAPHDRSNAIRATAAAAPGGADSQAPLPSSVERLRSDALNRTVKVSILLRQMQLVAIELKLSQVEDWIEQELHGYAGSAVDYRMIRGRPMIGTPNSGWVPIGGAIENLSVCFDGDPIPYIEDLVANYDAAGLFHIALPEHLTRSVNVVNGVAGWTCVLEVPRSELIHILDRVRGLIASFVPPHAVRSGGAEIFNEDGAMQTELGGGAGRLP